MIAQDVIDAMVEATGANGIQNAWPVKILVEGTDFKSRVTVGEVDGHSGTLIPSEPLVLKSELDAALARIAELEGA